MTRALLALLAVALCGCGTHGVSEDGTLPPEAMKPPHKTISDLHIGESVCLGGLFRASAERHAWLFYASEIDEDRGECSWRSWSGADTITRLGENQWLLKWRGRPTEIGDTDAYYSQHGFIRVTRVEW